MLLRHTLLCLVLWLTSYGQALSAADAMPPEMPNPLPLKTAITYAKTHPILQLSAIESTSYSVSPPLYLNCYQLAYSNLPYQQVTNTSTLAPLIAPLYRQQLRILQRYLDVHLADLLEMADNEAMSMAYIRYDRAKTRMELKQHSEQVVAQKEAVYYEALQRHRASIASTQLSRSLLAQALHTPKQRARDIVPMSAWKIAQEQPEKSALLAIINEQNQWLVTRKKTLKVAEKSLVDMQLQQQLTELLLQLELLRTAQQRFEKAANWRDLSLEYSRTLYEQEVKADLGDSMAEQTRLQFQQQQTRYCLNYTWAQLNLLQGKPLLTPPIPAKTKTENP